MKAKTLGYWITTALVAVVFVGGGAADLFGAPNVVATMSHLGYPAYVAAILGVWKLLGAAAILAPRWPRLKEWAYAGMLFDLTGAALSHGFRGDPAPVVLVPLVILGLAAASWALRPPTRVLGRVAPVGASEPAPALVKAAA
jgi:hypothetical protein